MERKLKDICWSNKIGLKTFMDFQNEAVKILKQNKEINTADWIEFFHIGKEFADECLNDANCEGGEKE